MDEGKEAKGKRKDGIFFFFFSLKCGVPLYIDISCLSLFYGLHLLLFSSRPLILSFAFPFFFFFIFIIIFFFLSVD